MWLALKKRGGHPQRAQRVAQIMSDASHERQLSFVLVLQCARHLIEGHGYLSKFRGSDLWCTHSAITRCESLNRIGDIDEGLQRMLPEPD